MISDQRTTESAERRLVNFGAAVLVAHRDLDADVAVFIQEVK